MVRPVTAGSIEDVIDRERDAVPFGATVVAVSPLFSEGLQNKLADLRERGHPVVGIHVGGTDTPEPPGPYEIRSMGSVFDLEALAEERLFRRPESEGRARG